MRAALPLLLALAACKAAEPPPAAPPMGAANGVVTASAVPDAGGAGSGGDVILPLGYPREATDAPAWTKVLVRDETIGGERRSVAVGWAKNIQSESLLRSAATMQARTRLLRVLKGQAADSTDLIEGEISDTRVEETFLSRTGVLFVKVSGPRPN